MPLLGRKYTWYKENGSAMSRLDRFLVSQEWIDSSGVAAQWALARDVSDHCPIVLKGEHQDWGPKPFRFNNCWLSHPGFCLLVEGSLLGFNVDSWKAFGLKEKLKNLKNDIRRWNIEVFGNIDHNIKIMEGEINSPDAKAELDGLNDEELELRRVKFGDLWQKMRDKESLLWQKSKLKWLREGDANTSFFHACISMRQRRNRVVAIQVEDK